MDLREQGAHGDASLAANERHGRALEEPEELPALRNAEAGRAFAEAERCVREAGVLKKRIDDLLRAGRPDDDPELDQLAEQLELVEWRGVAARQHAESLLSGPNT